MKENDKRSVRKIDKDTWEGNFFFDPDDGIYRTHFPGYPVVPGSLIVHAFLKAGREAGFSSRSLSLSDGASG
jgi:3-hydroxymyristoyl/3-hydroxydecanoyl-(acyl carrier protein) dehydratase